MRYIEAVRQRFDTSGFPVFSIEDVRLLLKGKRISNDYLYLLLHNLVHNHEIKRITKGVYTFHSDAVVVGFAFAPFYYGLENALAIRNLSEQGTNYTIMTSRNVRTGVRNFEGRNYRIQKIKKEHMFGYELVKYGNFWIPVSDVEKTVIDMLYFNDYIREELWQAVLKILNTSRLRKYLKVYDQGFRKKVLEAIKIHRHKHA